MTDVETELPTGLDAQLTEGQLIEALTEDGFVITGTVDATALEHNIVWVLTTSGERKMLHIIADNVHAQDTAAKPCGIE